MVGQKSKMTGKPNNDVKNALRHHSVKLLGRTAKLVKLFMIRQLSRKQMELDKSSTEYTEQLAKISEGLEWLKATSHNDIGTLMSHKLSIVDSSANHVNSSTPLASDMLRAFRKHSRMVQTFEEIETKIKNALERNSYLRSKQQRLEAKKARIMKGEERKQAKTASKKNDEEKATEDKTVRENIKSRYINMRERREAVFLDSLEGGDTIEREADLKRKQIKKEKLKEYKAAGGKKSKKAFKREENSEWSPYMPIPSDSQSLNAGSGGNHANDMRISNMSSHSSGQKHYNQKYKSEATTSKARSISEGTKPSTKALGDLTKSGKDWKQNGVHPSWAAKQLSKSVQSTSAVQPFQGKKMTFDD